MHVLQEVNMYVHKEANVGASTSKVTNESLVLAQ